MTRTVALGASLLGIALAGCGGGKQRNARHATDKTITLADRDVGPRAAEMPPYFAGLARKHGCSVVAKPDRTIADCRDEGVIGLGRSGTRIIVLCEGWMTRNQCERLFQAIAAEDRH